MPKNFWIWYEKRYNIIAPLTAFLFLLQLVHLYWMTTNIICFKIFGHPFWDTSPFWNVAIALVDYTEIPAIISTSILYIHQYQTGEKAKRWRNILFLALINSQWLHLFWITDEVIYAQIAGTVAVAIPVWLSWLAIFIDYLEIPVMIDSAKKAIKSLRTKTT